MKKRLLIAVLAALASASALADGRSAAQSLFANLERAGQDIGASAANTFAAPTLVRGMYALSDPQGKFIGYANEAGTLFGDSRGFNGLAPGGSGFRPLTPPEAADLRREMVVNIDKGKLITTRYGAGQKRLFMFSAIDCPACRKVEAQLAKAGAKENTTFLVVPSSLQSSEQQWQKVANIWCASDSERAWKTYWATGATPAAGACPVADGKIAERVSSHLWGMLKGAGLALHGTPAYVREDGLLLTKETLDLPAQPAKPAYWLAGADTGGADDFLPQPVGGRVAGGGAPLGSAIKGLFRR